MVMFNSLEDKKKAIEKNLENAESAIKHAIEDNTGPEWLGYVFAKSIYEVYKHKDLQIRATKTCPTSKSNI
jgi:hypothetical protein